MATCPALLTAIALLCLFGAKSDSVEAPPIFLILPNFSLMTPVFYTLFVVGLKQLIVLSSAVV